MSNNLLMASYATRLGDNALVLGQRMIELTVLGSGSRGNATYVRLGPRGVLLDCGLSLRMSWFTKQEGNRQRGKQSEDGQQVSRLESFG